MQQLWPLPQASRALIDATRAPTLGNRAGRPIFGAPANVPYVRCFTERFDSLHHLYFRSRKSGSLSHQNTIAEFLWPRAPRRCMPAGKPRDQRTPVPWKQMVSTDETIQYHSVRQPRVAPAGAPDPGPGGRGAVIGNCSTTSTKQLRHSGFESMIPAGLVLNRGRVGRWKA